MINGPAGYDPIQGGMRTEMKAGPGIDISHGTISTTGEAGVPYIGGTGINITGATVETDLTAGYRTEIISGATIGQVRYMPVETVSGSSVTMQAGHAYKIYAMAAAITLNTETIPANSFGLEGHLEIFVAGTSYVVAGSNVVLANALEPDAVNNCTVRFHDGYAIISVEDHVAGYIVTVNAASGAGSLTYGLSTATNEYISVDASLNGQTLDLAGATTYAGEKHVVGNGYTETILSGGINCTSKTTFSNLSMNGVSVNGGTMTLGDVFIPSGSIVAVSGGGLAVEKVTGAGETSVIDLGGTNVYASNAVCSASGVVFSGGSAINGGAVNVFGYHGAASGFFTLCTFSGNVASNYGGGVNLTDGYARLTSCTIANNTIQNVNGAGGGMYVRYVNSFTSAHLVGCIVSGHSKFDLAVVGASASATVEDCNITSIGVNGGTLVMTGSNTIQIVSSFGNSGYVTLTSGAIVDLTGNPTPTPIAPGGGIVVGSNVQIYPSAGSASAVTIGGGTFAAITNGGVLNAPAKIPSGSTVTGNVTIDMSNQAVDTPAMFWTNQSVVSGLVFKGTPPSFNGIVYRGPTLSSYVNRFVDCTFAMPERNALFLEYSGQHDFYTAERCSFVSGCNFMCVNGATPYFKDCFFEGTQHINVGNATFFGSTTVLGTIDGTSGSAIIASGAILDLTGNTNATPINPGGGIIVSGGCTVINSAGASVSIAGGTYSKINNDGTTE